VSPELRRRYALIYGWFAPLMSFPLSSHENSKQKLWQVQVPEALDELLEEAIERGTYVSKSDLIREAVREKLAKLGLLKV